MIKSILVSLWAIFFTIWVRCSLWRRLWLWNCCSLPSLVFRTWLVALSILDILQVPRLVFFWFKSELYTLIPAANFRGVGAVPLKYSFLSGERSCPLSCNLAAMLLICQMVSNRPLHRCQHLVRIFRTCGHPGSSPYPCLGSRLHIWSKAINQSPAVPAPQSSSHSPMHNTRPGIHSPFVKSPCNGYLNPSLTPGRLLCWGHWKHQDRSQGQQQQGPSCSWWWPM